MQLLDECGTKKLMKCMLAISNYLEEFFDR